MKQITFIILFLLTSFSFHGCKGEGGGPLPNTASKEIKQTNTFAPEEQEQPLETPSAPPNVTEEIKLQPLIKLQKSNMNNLPESNVPIHEISKEEKEALLKISVNIFPPVDSSKGFKNLTKNQKQALIKLMRTML